jgi:small redox-active disulfide protein 2
MEIKVLGTGCPKCKALEKKVVDTLAELGITAAVLKVDDIMKIMEYGVMRTPSLVINGKVVLSGHVPDTNEIKNLIIQNQ